PLKSTIIAATAPLHTSKTGARFGYFPALVMKSRCQSSSFDHSQFVRKTGFASISISNARHNKDRFLCKGHRPPSPKPHVHFCCSHSWTRSSPTLDGYNPTHLASPANPWRIENHSSVYMRIINKVYQSPQRTSVYVPSSSPAI
ncbi:MAG: hypothetical protein Q9204_003084, partial [Flavoplaca sp. TL-2023a]